MSKLPSLSFENMARAEFFENLELTRTPTAIRYMPANDSLRITLKGGTEVLIPRQITVLRDLPRSAVKLIKLSRAKDCFELPRFDVHISPLGMLRKAIFGEDPYARAGRATSPAKARAARRNGAKGGRPKRKAARR
jgi:hypothetical protein